MSRYCSIYAGNPTAGGTDGVEVSDSGTLTAPVSATVERGESATVTCAVRCATGYIALATIATATRGSGGTYTAGCDWMKVSTDGTNWQDSIQIDDIVDANVLFYVKLTGGSTAGTVSNGALRLLAEVDVDE